ncbi:hypothetical protein ACTFIY_008014 [Dictyostelium cf. discoideum]
MIYFNSYLIIQIYIPPPISLSQLQNPNPDDDEGDKNKTKTKTSECYILYDYFKLLSSLQTKKKLLDLDIVSKNSHGLKENYNITDSIDDLLIKLEINLKCFHGHYYGILKSNINQILNNQSISKEKQLKKIQRLVILVSRDSKFYCDYILKYEDSINEFHFDSYYSKNDCDDDESKLITFSRYILTNQFSNQSNKTIDKMIKKF